MSGPTIERGARTPRRAMRALQKASSLGQADGLGISFNPDTGVYSLILSSTGGTDVGGGGLELKLADASLQSTSSGVSVHPGSARGLSTDGSGLGIKLNTNPGLALSSGGLTLLEADSSLSLATGGAAVALNTTGGLQTSSGVAIKLKDASVITDASGLQVQLGDNSGTTTLMNFDFTAQVVGTNVGAIGGSGVTWYVTQNSFQPGIPDGSQVDSAMKIQTLLSTTCAGENTANNGTQAQWVGTLAIGSSYKITANMVPCTQQAGGVSVSVGIFTRADKAGHSASQGVSVIVYTDKILIQDNNGGATTSTAIVPDLSNTTAYDVVLTVSGNSFTATVNGFTATATITNNSTNTGLGFFLGGSSSPAQCRHFKVESVGAPVFSGLQVISSGLVVKLDGSSLVIGTNGVKVASPSPLTTKGDIFTFDTVGQRLGVGSNTQIITADSTQATGLKWVDRPVVLFSNTADSAAIANTVTPTVFGFTYVFPANYFVAGRVVLVRMMLVYSTTGTPTLNPLLRLGGLTVGGFGFTPTSAGLSGARLLFDFTLVGRTPGVSGKIARFGDFFFEISSSGNNLGGPDGGSDLTLDTTGTLTLDAIQTWGTASASDTIKQYQLLVVQMA